MCKKYSVIEEVKETHNIYILVTTVFVFTIDVTDLNTLPLQRAITLYIFWYISLEFFLFQPKHYNHNSWAISKAWNKAMSPVSVSSCYTL